MAPEIPTLIIANGVPDINKIASTNPELYLEIQRTMFLLASDYEKRINDLARHFQKNEKVVILCDRGKIDGRAYMSEDGFSNILSGVDINEHAVRESYDAAIHMVTAAKGAEAFYNTTIL